MADSSLVVYEGFAALVALDMWAADLVRSETAASGLSRLLRPGVGPALRLCVRSPAALLDDRLARLARLVAAR